MEANDCCEPFIQALHSKGQDCLHLSRQLAELRKEVSALRLRAETAEKDAAEAYAKGQTSMRTLAANAMRRFHTSRFKGDVAATVILDLPIKERP